MKKKSIILFFGTIITTNLVLHVWAEDSDLFDVLEYIAYSKKPIPRIKRAEIAEEKIYNNLTENQKEFIDFVLGKYVEGGVEELDINRLSDLIILKYKALQDGEKTLGNPEGIKSMFIDFQKHLYTGKEATAA